MEFKELMEKTAGELKAKELDLFKRYKEGDMNARDQLLISLRPIVKSYINKFNTSIPFAVMEGKAFNIISDALPKFDPSRNIQLNTFVYNQLQQMHRFVADNADIGYIPEARQGKITLYKNVLSNMRDRLMREPTTEELAAELMWPLSEVSRIRSELRGTYVEDPGIMALFATRNTDLDNIEYVYGSLPPIEQNVMEMLMGMHGREPMTLEETASALNITVSQVRYIKTKLEKKFKGIYSEEPMDKVSSYREDIMLINNLISSR